MKSILEFDPNRKVDVLMFMVSYNSLHSYLFPVVFLEGGVNVKKKVAPALYEAIYNKRPSEEMTFEDCFNDKGVQIALTRLEEKIVAKLDIHRRDFVTKEVIDGIKASHKPAPEGTVAELSQKYGVSKSEVRRLKREGRLQDLIETSLNG